MQQAIRNETDRDTSKIGVMKWDAVRETCFTTRKRKIGA